MRALFALFLLLAASFSCFGQILREGYDNNGTSANLSETILNVSNVSGGQFGKLFSQPVDGAIYAQPLYVANLTINGAAHNVVYVATMNDVLYAFDADTPQSYLWKTDLKVNGATAVVSQDRNITDTIGIESTPVIDAGTATMYLVAYTYENGTRVYRLHALDLIAGSEKFGGPVTIAATASGVTFSPALQMQRPALGIAGGQVLVGFGSFSDQGAYHGWVLAYAAGPGLAPTAAYCTTPTGAQGAIWQAGRGPVIDSSGNIYFATANGTYDGASNFGDSFIKLTSSLSLSDWFAPATFGSLAGEDLDLGSTGPLLIPGTTFLVGGGKAGILYLVNTASMGHETINDAGAIQEISLGSGIINGPAYYARTSSPGPWLYIWPNGGSALTAYQFNGATFNTTPVSRSSITSPVNSFSAALAVSANGSAPGTGLVWASMPLNSDGYDGGVNPGVLRVFDASNLTTELWDSNLSAARDGVGLWPKFRSPLVVNGKVYLGSVTDLTHGQAAFLSIYGLLSPASSASANSATFISRDLATQGNWPGVYGADGYSLAASVQSLPYYAALNVTTPYAAWTWSYPTGDPRGLMILPPTRIGGAWFNNSFVADVTVTGTHMVSIYAVDWDSRARSETVHVLDGTTLAILDSETLSPFTNGVWLSWNVSGHVKIIVTDLTGPNAVLSGVFFGPAYGTSAGGSSGKQSVGATTGVGAASAVISWPAISGATSYIILSSTSASGPFTQVGASTSATFTNTTVQHGMTYYYQIVPVVAVQ